MYSPSLLDRSNRSSSTMDRSNRSGGTFGETSNNKIELDRSIKSEESAGKSSGTDKSNKDEAMPMAPSLGKKAGSNAGSLSKASRPKRQKAFTVNANANKNTDEKKNKVTNEQISELDAMVAAVDSAPSDDSDIPKADLSSSPPQKDERLKSSKRSSSPGPIKKAKDYTSPSKSPSASPGQLKKTRDVAPKMPTPPPPQRSKSTKASNSKLRRSTTEDVEVALASSPPNRGVPQRRKSNDNLNDPSVHRRASRRKSNDSGSRDRTKSPGRKRHHHRRGSNDSPSSPGSHKNRSRSSEGDRGADLTKSPVSHNKGRRRGPSRSTSRSQPKTKYSSSSRPKLPSTLENELSESAAARTSKSKLSSPRHKMPTTMEEELISAVNSPRMPRRKHREGPPSSSPRHTLHSASATFDDDEEVSLSGDGLDQMVTSASSKNRSNKQRSHRKSSRSQKHRSEEEYEENLRGHDEDFKPTFNDPNKSDPSMNFMFEDSSNFENNFVIDLAATTNHTTRSNDNSIGGSLSAVSAFENDGFGSSFAMDFGAFTEDKKASKNINKNNDSKTDVFGFSSSENIVGGVAADELTPSSFGKNLDFGDDFGGDWKQPQQVYDKTPIEKPPINNVESMSTKIKWIAPKVNLVVATTPKNQNPPPVSNPLNGNLIICRPKSGSCDIVEWVPQRQTQVMAISILTTDLKHKVMQKYGVTPETVDTVWTVSAGIHRSGGNVEGLMVAALVDLTLLGDRNKEVLRLITVWNWGHHRASLQSVLSPPSGADFTYDTKSLKVADGCVFVAGASAKGPCVFLNKPTVRETWSANFIAKNTDLRISNMAVTNASKSSPDPVPSSGDGESNTMESSATDQRLPYLAVALNDGSLSVWTYEAAIKLTGNTKEAVRKLIYPLCRLHAVKFLKDCPITPWSSKNRYDSEKTTSSDAATELGVCTHLEWIPYRASAYKQLLLLAASYQGALCLYHVALPKVQDKSSGKKGYMEIKPPTEKTGLNQTISLRPFCFSKWATTHHRASCSFVDLGPHVSPSLVILMRGSHESPDYARVALITCPLQAKISGYKNKSSGDPLSFHVWDTHEWKNAKATNLPRGLIHSSLTSTRGILYYTDTSVQELEYRTNSRFPLGTSGVGSTPFGLTTSGGIYLADSKASAGVGLLSVYTTYNCERFKSTLSQDPSTPTLLEWTNPGRRHWLVQTFPGDSKDSGSKISKVGDELFKGGAQSTLICELVCQSKIKTLYPYRLARNPHDSKDELHVAVWFRSLYGSADQKAIGLVERDGYGIYGLVQLIEGRDAIFLPPSTNPEGNLIPRALVVSPNGGSVALWKRNKMSETLTSPWMKDPSSKPCRPILGTHPKKSESYVELLQYVLTSFQKQLSMIAVAAGPNNKFCLIAGALVNEDGLEDWSKVLPNIKEDPVLWLDEREQITLTVPLPCEGSIRGGIGVATTQRILIISPDLKILAAVDSEIPPSSLVPMGSYTVAYFSPMDHKLRYLSGLPRQIGRSGVIANFPNTVPSYYSPLLVGIRPDRFLYSFNQNGTRLAERGQSGHSFLLPLATTRPALLLEPMLANAIATGGNATASHPFLRTVLEKFGRKVATMSHDENEGIGNSGAGITPRVFELLEYYGLKSAASWLLTGTISFDRSANSRLLPSYLPVSVKAKAAFDADTHLHLVASGDQYFTEYVKSPDKNMSSTLPRPTDPTVALCQQFGRKAIQEGKFADAIKLLDISGTQTSDALILQMAMALQLDPSKDSQAIIDVLHQKESLTGKTPSAVASLAALASELRKRDSPTLNFHNKWLQSLAPSVQRSRKGGRHRSRLLGESSLTNISMIPKIDSKLFTKELPESKLVWNEGLSSEKENLLMLDNMGEWFGRKRPIVFGKEGAKRAEERGASTLAGILHSNDDDSFGGENEDAFKDGWIDGVGEGLKGK